MRNFKHPAMVAALVLLAIGSGAALAERRASGENDAVAGLRAAKISLAQAVAAAEAHARGRATGVELEAENGGAVFEVEVVGGNNAVYDVEVDAVTGKVLSSKVDVNDEQGEHEDESDENGAEEKDD